MAKLQKVRPEFLKTQEQVERAVASVVERNMLNIPCKLFLFGSRAENKARPTSDFDFGIEAQEKIPIFIYGQMKEDIEALPTLFSIDLVDFNRVNDEFKKIAKRTIKEIYF